jgi:capsular exopolysaccharide synthesis family protein
MVKNSGPQTGKSTAVPTESMTTGSIIMNQKRKNEENEIEIDLGRVLQAVLGKAWLVALVSVVCAVAMFAVTHFLITPQYQSKAMFYVNNNSALSLGDASVSISSGDLVTSRNLVDSYIVILNSRETLNDVLEYAQSSRSYGQLKDMINASAVNGTEIFQVVVTSPDPKEAEVLANAIAKILPERIGTIIDGTSAKIVDYAVAASNPSSPSYTKNILIGFLLGFMLTVGFVAVREMFDIMIRGEEDIADVCDHPVLTSVPDLTAGSKKGYNYSYGRDSDKAKKAGAAQPHALFGRDISFAAAESYKLLRTKLQFSFSDDSNCRVIGLSSSLSGEGKSLTSINLAYTLSQLNKKVILIDCDMRRPTLAEKLGIKKKPGLSSYLTGQSKLVDLVQNCGVVKDEWAFHVITAGQNPPNPVELLSSARMGSMLDLLKKAYDYVILDLPPVGEVTDALAVAKQTDGMLLVVRQNHCDRNALADTVRQFEFIESRILGIVYNCVQEHGGKGYYKKYYKGGYRRYYRRYYKGYDKAVSGESATPKKAMKIEIEE